MIKIAERILKDHIEFNEIESEYLDNRYLEKKDIVNGIANILQDFELTSNFQRFCFYNSDNIRDIQDYLGKFEKTGYFGQYRSTRSKFYTLKTYKSVELGLTSLHRYKLASIFQFPLDLGFIIIDYLEQISYKDFLSINKYYDSS